MSRPNISDDPQAPLLAGHSTAAMEADDEGQYRSKGIRIFGQTFSMFQIAVTAVGLLAVIAIGTSIAAIGTILSHSTSVLI
jgi:hypothetical protein